MSKQAISNVSLPASVYKDLCKEYGIKEKKFIANEALRQLESVHPSEFKVHWVTMWPKNETERVSITKSIPKLLWQLLGTKWGTKTPSELLRYGFYVMYAKRFEIDKGLDQVVMEAIEMVKEKNKQKALGYSVPNFPAPDFPKSDSKSIYTVPLEEFDNEREAREVERLLSLPALPAPVKNQ